MILSLDTTSFFTEAEVAELQRLGLWQDSHTSPIKLAFAGLLLASVMRIVMHDSATSPGEFEAIENYLKRIESELELATTADLETVGTEMGLLPMVPSSWDGPKYTSAIALLGAALDRLNEDDAHTVRNEIARAALSVARAGSPHIINLHRVDKEERGIIRSLVSDLNLQKSAEGLALLDAVG